jgi:hypothetical protein
MLLPYGEDREHDGGLRVGDILVAPVVEQGATARELYLPEGRWHDGGPLRVCA